MSQLIQRILVALSLALLAAPAVAAPNRLAPTPPMGWNSWDAYGLTITEAQFKANAKILARMRRLGWNTAVIDEGWYMSNPLGADLAARGYRYDSFGRLIPDTSRFPSAGDGNGLKALGSWTHTQGLKFGIHIVRGIPKAAVAANARIAGSTFHASDAADQAATCPWDDANFGIADNAAGQAYYDSLLRQYAGWGVDFIKVDCISDHPYRPTEIRQIAQAIRKSGRPMVLSLSPGPTNISHAAEVRRYSQMWRIMDDMWDGWTFPHTDPMSEFPNGIFNAFDRLTLWNRYAAPGSWPDADMLPFGSLYPHPGWGDPRQARLRETETRTGFTLWSIARSPLILGGNLTQAPAYLMPMLSNRQVIALNQGNRVSHPLAAVPGTGSEARIWVSGPPKGNPDTVAIFNVGEQALQVRVPWSALGFAARRYTACNLWTSKTSAASDQVALSIPAHDVALLRPLVGRGTRCAS